MKRTVVLGLVFLYNAAKQCPAFAGGRFNTRGNNAMSEQFVLLPAAIMGASQKYEAINLLATVARYSLPDRFQGTQLERDADVRFSGVSAVDIAAATAWLSALGVGMTSLSDQVSVLASGDTETLHIALQRGNDAGSPQLLAVSDASKLVELEDTGEDQLTPRPLWSKTEPCLLLRLGYSNDRPYAYYAASLPGDSRRPIKLTWQSVLSAGITAAVAILPPKPPVDEQGMADDLHILEQALATAHQAHASILSRLGLPVATSPALPAIAQQTV